ncbi:MAG: DUF2723 domain-containing protein [Winogradskyella sp.]|nr:DUF2723 domain-containing protein [Winogradskyella sp.]
MQASHPPGAPLYTIFSGTLLFFFSAQYAVLISNLVSAFFGASTVVMVYKITAFIIAIYNPTENKKQIIKIQVLGGLLAALSLAFSTSFWTASIEAEVYTMSFALFTLLIYSSLKWYKEKCLKKEKKYFLLFFLLLGLSVGVHLILLAAIIPASLLFVSKKLNTSFKNLTLGLVIGVISFFTLYAVILKGVIGLMSRIDIYSVNNLNLPVNYGAIITIVFVLSFLLISHLLLLKKEKHKIGLLNLSLLLFLAGSSLYAFPIIRSNTNTLVAEKVKTTNRLGGYISGERFGVDNIPLIYGPNFNAQLDEKRPFLNTDPILSYDTFSKKYIEAHDGVSNKINYSSKFKTIFPRMYDAKNAPNYSAWTSIKGEAIAHNINGEIKNIISPTFSENLSFFFNYQVIWLNLRYLYWNFIGRQNDHHGLGYIKDGNWVTGLNFIDKHRVGDIELLPTYYENNKAYDYYYLLPFLLGIIGCISTFKRKGIFLYLTFLFLTFGIGITVFVNPLPSSILIRERDYIFIGSFIIFTIWIGLSAVAFFKLFAKISKNREIQTALLLLLILASPIQLCAKGWDNHQNSKDTFPVDFAKAYLDSCPNQAILITNGDNMTFPLWYLQEVENYRKDVRVINFDQLNIDTHIDNLKRIKGDSKPISIDLDKDLYINGIEKIVPLQKETNDFIELEILTQFLNSDKTLTNWNGRGRHYVPGDSFKISADSSIGYIQKEKNKTYNLKLLNEINWTYTKKFYGLNDLVVLNLIKNNFGKRPICFAINGKNSHLIGLNKFLIQKGMVSELLPFVRDDKNMNPKLVDTQKSYEILVVDSNFKAFDSNSIYIKDENRTYAREIIRQNYYFLAQALYEENNIEKAKETLNKCFELFPNHEIPFKQFAYACGRLYYRMGFKEKGDKICQSAMVNIWNELQWITSLDPPNPIINVRHAKKLITMYQQMMNQIKPFNETYYESSKSQLEAFANKYDTWYINNWPY